MSDVKFLMKQVENMDKKSDDFAKLFWAVNDKYFDFDEPATDYQKAAQLLNRILHKGTPQEILLLNSIFKMMFDVSIRGMGAASAQVEVGNKKYFLKISTSADALARLHTQLTNTVIVKSQEEGK